MSRKKSGSLLAKVGTPAFPIIGLAIGAGIVYLSLQSSISAELNTAKKAQDSYKNGPAGMQSSDPSGDKALAPANANLPILDKVMSHESLGFTDLSDDAFNPPYPINFDAPDFDVSKDPIKEPEGGTEVGPDEPEKPEPPVSEKTSLLATPSVLSKVFYEGRSVVLFWDAPKVPEGQKGVENAHWIILRAEADDTGVAGDFMHIGTVDGATLSFTDVAPAANSPSAPTKYVYALAQGTVVEEGQDVEGIVGTKSAQVGDAEVTLSHGTPTQSSPVTPGFEIFLVDWYVTKFSQALNTISVRCYLWIELRVDGEPTWIRITKNEDLGRDNKLGDDVRITEESIMEAKLVFERYDPKMGFVAYDFFPKKVDKDEKEESAEEVEKAAHTAAVFAALKQYGTLNFDTNLTFTTVLATAGKVFFSFHDRSKDIQANFKKDDKLRKVEDLAFKAPVRDVVPEKPVEGEGSGDAEGSNEGEGSKDSDKDSGEGSGE